MMDGRTQVDVPMDRIEAFCRKWKVRRMWLFGSVLRGDFRPDSDVDVLVEFDPQARWSLLDLVGAEQELATVMGRPVDLVERECVEKSENWIRRGHILGSARQVYAA